MPALCAFTMPAGARWSPLARFSPSATPAVPYLTFIFVQILAVKGFVLRYLPDPSCPRAVVNRFPFHLHAVLQHLFSGCPGERMYIHNICDRNLSPLSFIPSTNLTSILTVLVQIYLVGIRRNDERTFALYEPCFQVSCSSKNVRGKSASVTSPPCTGGPTNSGLSQRLDRSLF